MIDSNVIIDIIKDDPIWGQWSSDQLIHCVARDSLAVNQIVLAEVAPQLGSLKAFHAEIDSLGITFESLSGEAAYCAGVAFLKYRQNRRQSKDGTKSIIADFLIGGHAQTLGATILTRDPRFYRAYFSTVSLITPENFAL